MIFYDNYLKLKKAEIFYNNVVNNNICLETINDLHNVFQHIFIQYINGFNEIFNVLISDNTKHDEINSYATIEDKSNKGIIIKQLIKSATDIKPEFMDSIAELDVNSDLNQIILNFNNQKTILNLSDNKIKTIISNKQVYKETIFALIKINDKEFLTEHSVNKNKSSGSITGIKTTFVDVAKRKTTFSKSSVKNKNEQLKRLYFCDGKKSYLFEKKNMKFKCSEVQSEPFNVVNNINEFLKAKAIEPISKQESKKIKTQFNMFNEIANNINLISLDNGQIAYFTKK